MHIFYPVVEEDGAALQAALAEYLNKPRVSVPQVFVQRGARHLGGCDNVEALHVGGKLVPLLFPGGPGSRPGGGAESAKPATSGAAASAHSSSSLPPVCEINTTTLIS